MKRFADLSITEGVIVDLIIARAIETDRMISVVVDGDVTIVGPTTDRAMIEKAYKQYIFDRADWIIRNTKGEQTGVVVLVHGNQADLIVDYSLALEAFVAPINDFINGN